MPIRLDDSATPVEGIRTMAAKVNEVVGDLIGDALVKLKSGDDMPERSDGGVAYGWWRAHLDPRQIWLWDEVDEYPVEKTLAHEAMHVVDSDWLTSRQRDEIIQLMKPEPTGWKDQVIHGDVVKYKGLPLETFAVYASAAVVGLAKPAYTRLFKRAIPEDKWPKLAEITLRTTDQDVRGTIDVGNVALPPDPLDDVAAELADLQARLTTATGAQAEAEIRRDLADGKLAQAKALAREANEAFGAGDVLTAQARLAEIDLL